MTTDTRPQRGRLREAVQVSSHLSCGCSFGKSEPIPFAEAHTLPGTVVICDRHQEYAVVTRVSTYLAGGRDALVRMLVDADAVDYDTACCIADEQTP